MLIPVSLPADRNAVDSVSPMVANSATGRREKPNALIFFTSSSQNGDSHFASTANSLFSINRAAAAEAANKVAKIRTDTKFAERYSAGDDVASITFVFSSE